MRNRKSVRCLAGVLLMAALFASCKTKRSSKHGEVDLNATPAALKQESLIMNLDSSLVSLKKAGMVSTEDVLSQTWIFDDADKEHWNSVFWDSATDTRQYPELALFPDHSAACNPRCGLRVGRWKLDKETSSLQVSLTGGDMKIFNVRHIALKQLELGDGEAVIRAKAEGIVHKDMTAEPYYPSNLQWMYPPHSRETPAEIRKRIRDYVHFYALFFADNHNRQETEINFSGLPSCFVWYNGGIGMQKKMELDRKWISCFFTREQAFDAYAIISDQISRHELKWPEHPKSWIEQTGAVLAQLAEKF